MMKYCEMTRNQLAAELQNLSDEYEKIKAQGIKLDISRGKPCTEQLNLSDGLLNVLQGADDCKTEAGFDCRNYGLFEGVPEAQKMFSELLTIPSFLLRPSGTCAKSLSVLMKEWFLKNENNQIHISLTCAFAHSLLLR